MGGEQAAGVLATVKRDGIERQGGTWSAEEEAEFKRPTLEMFEEQSHPLYASARLWGRRHHRPAQKPRRAGLVAECGAECPDRGDTFRRVPDVSPMDLKKKIFESLPEFRAPDLSRKAEISVFLIHNSRDSEDYFFLFDFEEFVEKFERRVLFVRPVIRDFRWVVTTFRQNAASRGNSARSLRARV